MRIAFIGPIGSGKTTMSRTMARYNGGEVFSFAEPLKLEVANFILENVSQNIENKYPKTAFNIYNKIPNSAIEDIKSLPTRNNILRTLQDPIKKQDFRKLLQWWGTEFRRKKNENYWVDRMNDKISLIPNFVNIFVDDCRFSNESEYLKENQFLFFGLEANPDFPEEPQRDSHASEIDWKTFEVDTILPWGEVKDRLQAIASFVK